MDAVFYHKYSMSLQVAVHTESLPPSPGLLISRNGFQNVTMSQMARAVNHLAWWLQKQIGTSSTFETVSYLGLPDMRYAMIFLAAVKCGYKVLFPSPRNTLDINNSLLYQTECTRFLVSPEMLATAESLKERRLSIEIMRVPALDDLLVDASEHYPFEKDYATARWEPIVVLHSSGSTGVWYRFFSNHQAFRLDAHRGIKWYANQR